MILPLLWQDWGAWKGLKNCLTQESDGEIHQDLCPEIKKKIEASLLNKNRDRNFPISL